MKKIGDILNKKKLPIPAKGERALVRFDVDRRKLRDGFTQIPNIVIDDYALDCQEKAILMALYRFAFGKNGCWPSINLLAQEAGCCEKTVDRRLKTLNDKGYLKIERTGKFNSYTLTLIVKKLKY